MEADDGTAASSTTKKRQTKPMTKKRKPGTTALLKLLKPSADQPDVHEKMVVPEVFISTVPILIIHG
jgi:hypothetical protein